MERLALCARWPAKSSVESWFSGSSPFSFRYSAHLVSSGQYFSAKAALPSTSRQRGQQDEHVAALFHRHLVLLGALAAAVDLAVGQRIRAQIVRREGPRPAGHACVFEHRLQLRLQQARIEEQRERRARIDHVHRGDAAVAEILLGEVHGGAVGIGHQLVRRQGLPVGQHGQPRVVARRPILRKSAISSLSNGGRARAGHRVRGVLRAAGLPLRRRCAATRRARGAGNTRSNRDRRTPASGNRCAGLAPTLPRSMA